MLLTSAHKGFALSKSTVLGPPGPRVYARRGPVLSARMQGCHWAPPNSLSPRLGNRVFNDNEALAIYPPNLNNTVRTNGLCDVRLNNKP